MQNALLFTALIGLLIYCDAFPNHLRHLHYRQDGAGSLTDLGSAGKTTSGIVIETPIVEPAPPNELGSSITLPLGTGSGGVAFGTGGGGLGGLNPLGGLATGSGASSGGAFPTSNLGGIPSLGAIATGSGASNGGGLGGLLPLGGVATGSGASNGNLGGLPSFSGASSGSGNSGGTGGLGGLLPLGGLATGSGASNGSAFATTALGGLPSFSGPTTGSGNSGGTGGLGGLLPLGGYATATGTAASAFATSNLGGFPSLASGSGGSSGGILPTGALGGLHPIGGTGSVTGSNPVTTKAPSSTSSQCTGECGLLSTTTISSSVAQFTSLTPTKKICWPDYAEAAFYVAQLDSMSAVFCDWISNQTLSTHGNTVGTYTMEFVEPPGSPPTADDPIGVAPNANVSRIEWLFFGDQNVTKNIYTEFELTAVNQTACRIFMAMNYNDCKPSH